MFLDHLTRDFPFISPSLNVPCGALVLLNFFMVESGLEGNEWALFPAS